jgi:hypothetical protein
MQKGGMKPVPTAGNNWHNPKHVLTETLEVLGEQYVGHLL